MGITLAALLRKHGISSEQDLSRFIGSREPLGREPQPDDGGLAVVDARVLGLDREHRLYQPEVAYSNTVLDVQRLVLSNSKSISFANCIICGDLVISQKVDECTKISLDYCIVLGRISMVALRPDAAVSLYAVNCSSIAMRLCQLRDLTMTHCRTEELSVTGNRIGSVYVQGSRITALTVCDSDLGAVSFDHRQIDLRMPSIAVDEEGNACAITSRRMFEFLPLDLGGWERRVTSDEKAQTVAFLRSRTNLEADKRGLARVKAFEARFFQTSAWGRLLVWLFGAFVSPIRILALWLFVFAGSAAFYTTPASRCLTVVTETVGPLDALDAAYFSGVTIATIGYGDIVPTGVTKLVAIGEGVAGIVLASCFVVSLLRRYIEK